MILRRSIFTVLIQVLQLVTLVGITILVTRVTGAHGRGIYTLVVSVAGLSAMVTGLGISWAGIYYIGKREFPLADVVSTLLTVALAAAVLTMGVLAIAYVFFQPTYFHDMSPTQALIMLALTALFQMATTTSSIVLGLNRPLQYAGLSAIQVVVALVIQVFLAVTGSLTATSALVALTLGLAISAGLGMVLVGREAPIRLGFDSRILRSFFNFGIRGYAANLMMTVSYRLDALMVNGLSGVMSLGYYSVATAMAEGLWYGANALALVMFPHISSMDKKEADRITPVVCRNAVFLTLIGAVVMFAVSRQLILAIFGPALIPALQPLWLLLPGIVTLTVAKIITSYLSGIGKPIYSTYLAAGSMILTVVMDLALIPPYGINGAAAASSIVYTLTAVASVWIFKRESGAGLLETMVVRAEDFVRYRRLVDSTWRRLFASTPARS
ncbi:MAG TPA: polysaccharide biosynthesis C-terminal domain-containing protein [Candidatus Limnocylindria bacterium]|jgi:O-antigen/teichoic acid export membrane protein|nr:polysaccharide biosynthesis C-terminal domain-containing protein [Candidatus Limnocylindria bacterium]